MSYNLKGNIRAYYCGDCFDVFYRGKIRFYLPDSKAALTVNAVADAKDTFHQRTEEELQQLQNRFIGETETDENGNFSFVASGDKRYTGGALDIDFDCGNVPLNIQLIRQKLKPPPRGPLQFHITTFQPMWKQDRDNQENLLAFWEYAIPYKFWCRILHLLGLYVICGHVRDCKEESNIAGVKVFAYDVDLIQDDYLGYGITDAAGNFKIYYTEADFSKTLLSWLNVEWAAGPDLYFRIEAGDGTVLLNENRQRGHDRDRANATNCFCIDFCVECPKGSLVCALEPISCLDSAQLLSNGLLAILGTASGCGMNKYSLEILWDGTMDVSSGAVVYPDAAGNPNAALTFGNHAVLNGKVGFININKILQNAGSNIITNTNFVIRLTVQDAGGAVTVCTVSFQINASEVYIKNIGGRVSHDVTNPAEPLRIADTAVADEGAVGGSVTVWGAARIFGCDSEKISNYGLYWKNDDFLSAQPANGTAYNPLADGWTTIGNVDYAAGYAGFTPDQLRAWNDLAGPSSVISNNGFYTYDQVVTIFGFNWIIPEGLTLPVNWNTRAVPSGRYSMLLKITDTLGNTYYDIQRVWVDNDPVASLITQVGSQPPCTDLYTKDKNGNFKVVDIKGTAWDSLIIAAVAANPSDNFLQYDLYIQKQGGAGAELIKHSVTPVPARPAPSGVGVLYSFDLSWINTLMHTPGDNKLLDGEACAYVFSLYVYDKTAVDNDTTDNNNQSFFPIKIINSNEP